MIERVFVVTVKSADSENTFSKVGTREQRRKINEEWLEEKVLPQNIGPPNEHKIEVEQIHGD